MTHLGDSRCPACGHKINAEAAARKRTIIALALDGKLLREIAEATDVSAAYAHKVLANSGIRLGTRHSREEPPPC